MSIFPESQFVNQRTGFFKALVHQEHFLRPIAFHSYSPVYSLTSEAFEERTNSLSISGAGMSREEAKAKCLGEALERYCWYYAGSWMKQDTTVFNTIRNRAIAPSTYGLFSDFQYAEKRFPFKPFREDTELHWVEGVALGDRTHCFVPAQLVCPRVKDRHRLSYYTTTGLACSDNYFKAIYTAICEVIERDAFMLMWTNRIPPMLMAIEWQRQCGEQKTLEYLNTSKYRCLLFSLYTDIDIPVFMTVLVNKESTSPYLSFGVACDCDKGKAARKSLTESLHNLNFLMWAHQHDMRIDWHRRKVPLKSFDEHALLYANPHMEKEVSFILKEPHRKETIVLPGAAQSVDYEERAHWLITLLAKEGYRIICVDLTPKEIKTRGYYVIKALIPGFMDLGFDKYYWLGNRRIYEVPPKLGFKRRNEAELNTCPHPFP